MKADPLVTRVTTCILALIVARQSTQASMESLPAPTGAHKTGRMSFHWTDASRDANQLSKMKQDGSHSVAGENSPRREPWEHGEKAISAALRL